MPAREQLERTAAERAAGLVLIRGAHPRYTPRGMAVDQALDVLEHGLHLRVAVFRILAHRRGDQRVDALVQLIDEPRRRRGTAGELVSEQVVRRGAVER